jgi:hypothetical protein
VEPEPEAGRHAEVPAAAPDRPEEVGVRVGVHPEDLTVGGDQLGSQQRVDRQAVLPDQEADAATERDPPDADGPGVAEAGGQVVGVGRDRVPGGGQPGVGPGSAGRRVDLEPVHLREVEHDAVVDRAVPGQAVAAAADSEVDAGLADRPDHTGGVVRVGDADDHLRAAVDVAVEHGARLVVSRVVGPDDRALDVASKLGG